MYVKQEVGDKIYLWTVDGPVKKNRNKMVVISAHGIQSLIGSHHQPSANIKLVFYGPHGKVLLAPSVNNILYGTMRHHEKVSASKGQDYTLGKFQSAKHGGGDETYSAIANFGKSADETLAEFPGFDRTKLEAEISKRRPMDIITVRNRRFSTDPTLKEIIYTMSKNGFDYDEYHCSFCRGGQNPFKPDSVHDSALNTLGA